MSKCTALFCFLRANVLFFSSVSGGYLGTSFFFFLSRGAVGGFHLLSFFRSSLSFLLFLYTVMCLFSCGHTLALVQFFFVFSFVCVCVCVFTFHASAILLFFFSFRSPSPSLYLSLPFTVC